MRRLVSCSPSCTMKIQKSESLENSFTSEEDNVYDPRVDKSMGWPSLDLWRSGRRQQNRSNDRALVSLDRSKGKEECGSKELKSGTTYRIVLQFGSVPTPRLRA